MIKDNVRIYKTGVFDVWKNNALRRIFRIYFLGWYECWKWKLVISIENFELWHKTWHQRVYYFLINKNWRKSRKWWNELVLIIYKKKKYLLSVRRETRVFKKSICILGWEMGEKIEYRDNFVRKFFSFRNFQRHTCFWNNVCVFFNFNEESTTV